MKKTLKKKLSLSRVTVRNLSTVVGGYLHTLEEGCHTQDECFTWACQTRHGPCPGTYGYCTYGACSSLCDPQTRGTSCPV